MEGTEFFEEIVKDNKKDKVVVRVVVHSFVKVDDILFNQKLLKKTVRKGNSTNKASDGSIVYYSVGFFDSEGNLVKQDSTFDVETDSLEELKNLGCRTHYLDE